MNINSKIICLIDALGPGGAERQMTGLASMLKKKGYEIKILYFEPKDFFVHQLINAGVLVKYVDSSKGKIRLLREIRREVKSFSPEVVISYLQSSSIIACLLKLSGLKYKLIVSERNTNISNSIRDIFRFNLFRMADYVVPNSYSQQEFINEHFPFLKEKNRVIVNFVDTEKFTPIKKARENLIVVVATIWPSKNTIGFIKALKILKDKGFDFYVKWFGKVSDQNDYLHNCETLIVELKLQDYIVLLDKTQNIAEEYRKADYFCLPSFYEGTPNVICEAMASGIPVACSDVCDNHKYVENNINGFLFSPNDSKDIAVALEKMVKLNSEEYYTMCDNNRKKAIEIFSKDKFIYEYVELLKS